MDFYTAAVFLALVAGSLAGPVLPSSAGSCAAQCTESTKLVYQPGTVYEFEYEGKTSTGIHGASDDNAGLKITSNVQIGVLSKCELKMELSNTILYGADPDQSVRFRRHSDSNLFRRALQNNPLHFSFQDGIIDELCPGDDEPTWVLNIKRGILSAFQNGMDSLDISHEGPEIDVTGRCATTYTMTQDGWRTRTIKKTKDLDSCSDRHGFDSSAHSSLYKVPSSIQNLPLMKSTHECDQEFDIQEKILKRSVCHEVHLFHPFSNEDNGATTEVLQKLTFVSSEATPVKWANINTRTTLVFEHEGGEREATVHYEGALSTLRKLCTSTDIRPETPRAFSELVYELKKLDTSSLNSVFQRVSTPHFCPDNSERVKKFYVDAIPMVGTGAAVNQITERIRNNDISATFVEMWLASLSFVQHPTKEMLTEVMRLVDLPNGEKVILPLSALVNTYCRDRPVCGDDVVHILAWLEDKIGDSCQYTDATYMQVLLSLRAVGNIGLPRSMLPSLRSCFTQKATEVRLAAVEAYRRFPCSTDRSALMGLYRDSDEDAEMRIAAYLQVMKCADTDTIAQVKEQLTSEKVNQVGSFVWTHLTNLMDTSDPTKQDIRAILLDQDLHREFDMDRRKFSRNYEVSYFSEKFNIGGSMENNVVWSPKSFVPRSLMANLTVDLFGHSYNLLEIGGRAEGLEHLLEAYFGPSGHLRKHKASSPAPGLPTNRALNMNKLHTAAGDADDQLEGSVYMRVFGNEVKYVNLKRLQRSDNLYNFDLDAFFSKLIRDGSVSYTYSDMFLDSSMIIPTMIGFPLNLTVNGTLTTGLTGTGRVDLRRPKALMLLDGNIEPSGAVAISAMMSVDAFITKGGMKMVSTLHTSTAIRGKLELSNNKDFTLELDFPRHKSEVINMESSFFMVQGDQEKVQGMVHGAEKSFCTGNTLMRLSGLNTCIRARFPNASDDAPHFPLTGPVTINVDTTNEDLPHGYKFELRRTSKNETNDEFGEEVRRLVTRTYPGVVLDLKEQIALAVLEAGHLQESVQVGTCLVTMEENRPVRMLNLRDCDVKIVKGSCLCKLIEAEYVPDYTAEPETDEQTLFHVSYETPGSRVNRAVGFNVDIRHMDRTMEMNLVSPWKKARFTGNLVSSENMKKIEGKLAVDDARDYRAVFELQRQARRNVIKYTPNIEITTHSRPGFSLTGTVDYVKQTSLTADLVLTGAHRDTINMNGVLVSTGRRKKVEWNVHIGETTPFTVLVDVPFHEAGNTFKLNPVMSATIPGYNNYNATGAIEYRKKKMLKADIIVNGFTEDPGTFNALVKFTPSEKSCRVKFSYEANKAYEGEMKMMIRQMKSKSTQYIGLLSMKTPTKFLAQIKTRLVHKVDSSAKFELVIEKIMKVPIKIKGMVSKTTKKQSRTLYRGIVRYNGPKRTDIRLKFDVDKRLHAVFFNSKVIYNFLKIFKGAKDQLDFNWKAVRTMKTVQTLEFASNFKSSKYGIYNNKMNVKGSYRPGKLVETVVVFDHGRNYLNKDNKKRVTFNVQSTYKIRKGTATVGYSLSCRYPWQTLTVSLDGSHFHDPKNVNSSMTITHKAKQLFQAAAVYNDGTKKGIPTYSGDIAINVDGRPIGINAQVSQVQNNEYEGTLQIQHEKKKVTTLSATYRAQRENSYEVTTILELYDGKRTEVSAIYTNPSNTSHRLSTGIQWYDGTSITTQGALILDHGSPLASLSFAFGTNSYAMSLSGENKSGYRRVASDIQYPARHILVEVGAGMKQNKYMVLSDVQWDADNHADSRVKVEGTYRNEGMQNFETGALIQVPNHLYSAFLRHLSTTKYNTAVEFAWAPKKKIAAEIEFEDIPRKYRRDLHAVAGFSTPFEHFEEMKTTLTYGTNKRQVSSSLAFKYAADKTLSLAVAVKKPVTIRNVNLKVIVGTPHPRVGEATLSISHLLSDTMTEHIAESTLEWGTGNRAYLETNMNYQKSRSRRTYYRNIGFLSTIPTWELVTLNVTHMDDFRQFDSKAVYNRNNEMYHYDMVHDFTMRGSHIQNSGTFNITSPKDSLHVVWSHENTDHDIDSRATMSWSNGQRFSAALYGDVQYSPTMRITGRFDADIPSTTLNRIRARFEHADRPGKIKTNGHVHADGENIFTVQSNYLRQLGSVDYNMLATSAYIQHDFKTVLKTRHAIMPYTGELEIEWDPEHKINLDGSLDYNLELRKVDSTVTLTSPFRYAIVTASHKMDGLEWVASTNIEFAPQRKIIAEARYRMDELMKHGRFTLTTPIPQLQRIDTALQYAGHPMDFSVVGNMQVIPYLPSHDVTVTWLMNRLQMKGTFDVNNAQFSYANVQFTSNVVGPTRRSNAALEFMDQNRMRPQRITADYDYTVHGDVVDGTISFASPYIDPVNIQYKQTGNLHDFSKRTTIRYGGNKQITSMLQFGDVPNVNGKLSLITPYRGTENVEIGFVHDGTEWKKFKTEAVYGTNGKNIKMEAGLNILDALNGKIALASPFAPLQIAQVSFSHSGDISDMVSHGDLIYNQYVTEGDATFQHDATVTTGTFVFKSPIPDAEEMRFTFSKDGNPSRFMVHGEAYKNMEKVELDINFEHTDRVTSGTISSRTNINDIQDVALTFSKDGFLMDFTAESSVRCGSRKVDSSVGFSHNDQSTAGRMEIRGLGTVADAEDFRLSFTRRGTWLNFQNEAMVMYGQQKAEIRSELDHSPAETSFKLTLPIHFMFDSDTPEGATLTFTRAGQFNNWRVHGKMEYQQKLVEVNSNFVQNDMTISSAFNLVSNYERVRPVRLTFSKEGSLPSRFRTHSMAMYDQQKLETDMEFALDAASLTSKFQLSSNVPDVKNINVTLTRQGTLATGFKSEAVAVYDQSRLGSKLGFSHDDLSTSGNFEVTSNIPQIKAMSLSISRQGLWRDFNSRASGVYDKYRIQSEVQLAYSESSISGQIAMTNNFLERKSMEIAFTRAGNWENMKVHGLIACDADRFEVDLGLSHDRTITTGTLSTSCTLDRVDDLMLTFTRTSKARLESVSGEARYGTLFYTANIDAKVVGNDIDVSGTITSPQNDDIVFSINHDSRRKGSATTITGTMGADNSLRYSTEYRLRGNVLLFTSDKEFIIKGERSTEQMTLDHKGGLKDFKTNIVYVYNGKQMKATITVNVPSIDNAVMTIVATTSFDGYKDLSLRLGNIKTGSIHRGTFELTYATDKTISATSAINLDSQQKTINFRLTSPFEGAESASLDVTHTGDNPLEFHTAVVLVASALSSPVRSEVAFRYNNFIDIDASSSVTYGEHSRRAVLLFHYDDRQFSTQLLLQPATMTAINFEASGKMIGYAETAQPASKEIGAKMKLITPFECVRNLEVLYEASQNPEIGSTVQRELVTYDDVVYHSYIYSTVVHDGLFNITGIWYSEAFNNEFIYKAVGNIPELSFDVDWLANWNKTSQMSNIRILANAVVQKSEDTIESVEAHLQAIHPSRTVAMRGGWTNKFPVMPNHMEVSWDENSGLKAGYNLKWADRNKLVKVMTPMRSVELRGIVVDDQPTKVREYELYWDADRDRSQHASVRLEKYPDQRQTIRVGVNVPTTNEIKELSLVSEFVRLDNGHYNSRTEFSYSSDSSKSIVLTSRYEDLSVGDTSNCSVTLGLSHAHSRLDVSATAHLASGPQKQSVGISVSHHQTRNLIVMGEIDMLRQRINIMAIGPSKAVGMMGEMSSPYRVAVRSTYDTENLIDAEASYDPMTKSVNMQMKYDEAHPNHVFHMMAQYPNNLDFTAEMYRTGDFPRSSETLLNLHLKTSRLLHTKLHWRPEMLPDLMGYASDTLHKYGTKVNTVLSESSQEFGNELDGRYNYLSNEIQVELQPVAERYAKQIEATYSQLRQIKQTVNDMYRNNHLYLRDINEQLGGNIRQLLALYGECVDRFSLAVRAMRQRMSEVTNTIQTFPFEEKYNEQVDLVIAQIQEYRAQLQTLLSSEKGLVVEKVTEILEKLREYLIKLTDDLSDTISETLDEVMRHPDMQEARRQLEELLALLPDSPQLPIIDYQAYLTHVHHTVTSNLRSLRLAEQYTAVVEGTKEASAHLYNSIYEEQDLARIRQLITELYDQVMSSSGSWPLTTSIQEIATDLYESSREFITEDIGKLKLLNWHKNRIIVFDPENGNIEFEVYLLSPSSALDRIPKFSFKKYVNRFKKVWERYVTQLRDLSFWDIYYKYVPSCNPRDWIPPFQAYAIVAGSRHYVTFDNKKFDFAGMCSYVLTQDVHDNNFSVVVNFNRNRQTPEIRSLLVMTEGKNIELFNSGVHVDGRPSELPFNHQGLSVERVGNLVKLNTGRGLEVIGDVEHEHFVIAISGWYFGKVVGLLGTYDNEQFDDMTTIDGTITDNMDTLSESWQVNKRCRLTGNILDEEQFDEQSAGYDKCAFLFKDYWSPLRPCFKQVDPEYYMHMCLSDVQRGKRVCDVASVYVRACQIINVRIWLPQQCIQCETPDSDHYNAGETIKLYPGSDDYHVPQSADFVFVVERRQCNREAARHLGSMVYKLEQGLAQSEMSDNRYGLLSYGVQGASSHTIESQLFNRATKFNKGAETLTFNEESATNAYNAILAATNYPFRTGVSKTIVLVQCDECPEISSAVTGHLQHILYTRDITLHILRDQEFRLANNRIPQHKIQGVDTQMKYMLDPDHAHLYDDMAPSTDSCSRLALYTNGSIFDSTGFTHRRMRDKKRFFQMIVERLVGSAVPQECQVCRCVSDHTGAAMSVCRKCFTTLSDYFPQIWSNLKHPQVLRDEFEEQLKDHLGDGMRVFSK